MSRVLMLLPSIPAPLDSGAKIRNHGLRKLLSEAHEVDVLAFGESAPTDGVARSTVVVPPPPPRSAVRRALDIAASDRPDMAIRLWSPEFLCELRRLARSTRYDAVQAEGIEMARYLEAVPRETRVYDAHNAEFLLQRRLTATGSSFARLYSRLQWRRLERFERGVVRSSRLTLAVSNHDANQLLALAGADARVQVVPNGIDAAAYPFCSQMVEARPNLLFLGKLDFRPNADAVRWFTEKVLQYVNQGRLFAVGAQPPDWLVRAGQHDDRIVVTGHVASEQPYLRRCAALVLPLQIGGGSRLKALIAMASGLPIVSTRLGMEGLDVEPERHYLAAELPGEWVSALQRLLNDAGLRQQLARNGRELVEKRYDWSAIRGELQAVYAGI